ncbi:TPR-like protein [Phanerochaete sordida]|uniref:TPR-like protein n=1 Tax=Phanerochaete sordida TaxID=48140 RepID=A0A9P3LHL9_9APHY|nr:TPR-like protein [Phanerochaete sordida]
MTEFTSVDEDVVSALRSAVRDCSERGLTFASKWASELLLAIPASKRAAAPPAAFNASTPARPSTQPFRHATPDIHEMDATPLPGLPARHPQAPSLKVPSPQEQAQEMRLETEDEDSIASARALIDAKEFSRAVHWLKDCKSAKALFMMIYSQYMATEKKAMRDWYKFNNTKNQPTMPVNPHILNLLQLVQNSSDPWLSFLKALFLRRLGRREEAIESALLSIAGYPWNWSTWIVLGECVGDGEELSSLVTLLPLHASHPLVQMFQVKTLNTLNNPSENELSLCDRLLGENFFPRSLWLMSMRACVLYHLHDFGNAEVQFRQILQIDPFRIDDIDVYSNILYVTENRLELSKLAHDFLLIDKDRPEVCCLVGNHYSLRAEHEKAVKYFRRATQLDRTYLSAWTLMGHEYVEMKNSHAAIETYRKAVDVNRKDYRAWYGLGQAYELLSMHQYALYYYQHATALRPYDVRIWQAQGMCYEEMHRPREAIECLKRALIGADPMETTIHLRLAKLYHDEHDYAEAANYHRHVVELCLSANKPVIEYSRSAVHVAQYHLFQGGGDLELAKSYMEKVAASNAEEVREAADLLKKIKVSIAAKQLEESAAATARPDDASVGTSSTASTQSR